MQNTDVAIASIGSSSVQLSQEDDQIDDNADLGVESDRNEGTSSILNLGPSEVFVIYIFIPFLALYLLS